MGGLRIFLKNHRTSLFKATFQMNLISAGSISLDSTFNGQQRIYDTDTHNVIFYKGSHEC